MDDAVNGTPGTYRYGLVPLNQWQECVGRLRFRADHAAGAFTKPAKSASRPRNSIWICIGLAEDCRRCGIRMVSQRLGGLAEHRRYVWDFGRRIRILGAAPALEDVAAIDFFPSKIAGLAGNAHQLLGPR